MGVFYSCNRTCTLTSTRLLPLLSFTTHFSSFFLQVPRLCATNASFQQRNTYAPIFSRAHKPSHGIDALYRRRHRRSFARTPAPCARRPHITENARLFQCQLRHAFVSDALRRPHPAGHNALHIHSRLDVLGRRRYSSARPSLL